MNLQQFRVMGNNVRRFGTRALGIARILGDLDLQILTTSHLETVHYSLAEYERAVELAKGNLAALPAKRIYDRFGRTMPPSIFSRYNLVLSLCQLGRFREAAEYLPRRTESQNRRTMPYASGTTP